MIIVNEQSVNIVGTRLKVVSEVGVLLSCIVKNEIIDKESLEDFWDFEMKNEQERAAELATMREELVLKYGEEHVSKIDEMCK